MLLISPLIVLLTDCWWLFGGTDMLSCLFIKKKILPCENSPLCSVFPPTTACVIESAHLSGFLRRPLKLCWYVVVISRVCDMRAARLFRGPGACVCVSQCVLHMWQIWDSLDCSWDTPLQATVFKKNLQRTPNQICSTCHVKSFSRWSLFFSL